MSNSDYWENAECTMVSRIVGCLIGTLCIGSLLLWLLALNFGNVSAIAQESQLSAASARSRSRPSGGSGPVPATVPLTRLSGIEERIQRGGTAGEAGNKDDSKPEPYVIMSVSSFVAGVRSSGGVYVYVADTPRKKVESLLHEKVPGRIVTFYLCQGAQRYLMRTFGPSADQFVIWPFHLPCWQGPGPNEVIWPSYDNPFVNRLREIRLAARGKKCFAYIHPIPRTKGRDVWALEDKRDKTYEELEWQILAVIGADYDGIVWSNRLDLWKPWAGRLKNLAGALAEHRNDLAAARPVRWVEASANQPVSALCAEHRLFVVLLNSKYMMPAKDGKTIPLPLGGVHRRGQITLRPSGGRILTSGKTLYGQELEITARGGAATVPYRFAGGGQVLIFDLSSDLAESSENPEAGSVTQEEPRNEQ